MRISKFSIALAILVATVSPTGASAATGKLLYTFKNNGRDGKYPNAALVFDSSGNLYGTTVEGGPDNNGTVFELTPVVGGGWSEKVLRVGGMPYAGLVLDAAGNIYGATVRGGAYTYGTVFELTPTGDGHWTNTVLHSFNRDGIDGYNPYGTMIFDAAGNLYGTTNLGGAYGYGTVFELSPAGGGSWTETILHSFNRTAGDGYYSASGLVFDAAGNLYGTTVDGGTHDGGTVYELSPAEGGSWTETILYSFSKSHNGHNPEAALIFDGTGNLYGTTGYGLGAVFELSPVEGGGWTATLLHGFVANGKDGENPFGSLIFDGAGNLWGTTSKGGVNSAGTLFELMPQPGGGWKERVLPFTSNLSGSSPNSSLILDGSGNFYGTANAGGANGVGTVFEYEPAGAR